MKMSTKMFLNIFLSVLLIVILSTVVFSIAVARSSDYDDDGLDEFSDNCPFVYNPNQADLDGDGIGDACDSSQLDPIRYVWGLTFGTYDSDGDGIGDYEEIMNGMNPNKADTDGDGIDDGYDKYPNNPDGDNDGFVGSDDSDEYNDTESRCADGLDNDLDGDFDCDDNDCNAHLVCLGGLPPDVE